MMGNEENKTLYDIYRGILCNNQSFQLGKQAQVEYRFDCPEYAELKEKYHLNEIAGNGTELEHSVRLLKYLAPKLTHSAWYDNSVPCNGLALLEYSLEQPEHGINCLNKSKILEECCLALGIYARRVRMLPYSPFDSDCHVVTEIFDRTLGKWCMLDPTTNGYLVDETGSVLSLLEARERMAQAGFVTFCRADETVQDLHEVAQKEMEWSAYFAKNLFRLQIDAVSQFGETGKWLDVIPEHFSVRQWSKAKAEYRITMAPEYAKTENGFEMAKMLPLFQKAVKEAETMQDAEGFSEEPEKAGDVSDQRVNINRASKETLMTLPGIGEAKAEAILAYRQAEGDFESPEALMNVPGIKEGVFAKIKDRIAID